MCHILFIQPKLDGVGGIEKVIPILASSLKNKGYRVSAGVITGDISGVWENKSSLNENPTKNIFHKIIKIWTRLFFLRKLINNTKPDYILVSTQGISIIVLFLKWLKLINVPVYIYVHEGIDIFGAVYKKLILFIYPNADKIICVSDGIALEIIKQMAKISDKIISIHNSIPVGFSDNVPNLEEEYKGPVFMTASRLEHIKGVSELVNAFIFYAKKNEGTLLVIGTGSLEADLKKNVISEAMEDRIIFLGYKEDIRPYLLKSDIYLSTAPSEPFGLSLLEAITMGTPVVATDVPYGPREILGVSVSENFNYPYMVAGCALISDPKFTKREDFNNNFSVAIQKILAQDKVEAIKKMTSRSLCFSSEKQSLKFCKLFLKVNKKITFVGATDLIVPFIDFSSNDYAATVYEPCPFLQKKPENANIVKLDRGLFGFEKIKTAEKTLPFYLKGLIKSLRNDNPDIIIVMDFIRLWYWQVIWYKIWHPKVKVILYSETQRFPRSFINRIFFSLFLFVFYITKSQLSYYFTFTILGQDFAKKYFTSKKIKVMPAPVDIDFYSVTEKRNYTNDGTIRLLMNARYVDYKKHSDLLEALKLIIDSGAKFSLTLIGRGGNRRNIELLVDKFSLKNQVKILEAVTKEELVNVYSQHDVLVLPSDGEAVGMVVPEAMACGLATVTSDSVGANIYVLPNETGLIYRTGDIKALAESLLSLSPVQCADMGTAAKKHIKNIASYESLERKIKSVFVNI